METAPATITRAAMTMIQSLNLMFGIPLFESHMCDVRKVAEVPE
jgi:hypothetical protein